MMYAFLFMSSNKFSIIITIYVELLIVIFWYRCECDPFGVSLTSTYVKRHDRNLVSVVSKISIYVIVSTGTSAIS